MSDLATLLARVEAAADGEFSLDDDIATALNDWTHSTEAFDLHSEVKHLDTHDGYSFSIDAAIGLVERMLPSYLWQVKHGIGVTAIIWSLETDYDDISPPTGSHMDSPPLAILAALLRALIEKAAR